jgi:hypothetical protein
MEKKMALFKSLILSRDSVKAPVHPEKEGKCGEFSDSVVADR